MKGIALAAGLVLATMGAATGQDAEAPAIRGVIQSQVDAFLQGDSGTAFTYASPMIQGMFGTSQNFGLMVQQGYPMIWAPKEVEFLGLREENGRTLQRMRFTDGAGGSYLFDYEMVPVPGAGWKINGVYPVAEEAVGA